ncbi:PA2778 family cysteine peptidase [Undibacterium sp. Jales W-56]|uniref:PA2778 family cysteine peptidase n=1 Tax=Undibacterium sp. Jales W-56 TaxID=2897325 RepID=UPI0021D1DE64|nr:PA2778 family cysteine peptidase [Undibacterium sp. Jales W-56]MCU6432387.1 PA2778 family cysteine peptidase [Undibacterium sp. Jales W-56]
MIRRVFRQISPAIAGVFVLAVLTLAGCATPQMLDLAGHWPADLPAQTEMKDVPFFPQEEFECGPAALAMVLQAAGVQVTPDALVGQVYLPGRKGSLQLEMLVASRRNGVPGYVISPTIEALLREVAAGHPVLVFQNLSLPVYPVWHYAVVIGFDRARNQLILHSGRTARAEMSLFTFERTWARGDYWAMVALAPDRLPATAEAERFAASIAALERSNPLAAQTAYATALKKWPDHRTLLIGAGNTAYALKLLPLAADAYRATLQMHPDFADAWNNLAQTLLDLGQRQEAATAIAHAVALGGVRLPQYLSLQRKIDGE